MRSEPHEQDDPFGYREDLTEALLHPGFETSAASKDRDAAALSLCRALGRCRLFGVSLDERIDGAVPFDVAQSAALEFLKQLQVWTQDATTLSDQWDEASDPIEAEDLCGGMLMARMDAWAIWIAIDESYQNWLAVREDDDVTFDNVMDQLVEAMEEFDSTLMGQLELLSTIADLHLLDNWRSELANELQSRLPWWLDSTLEDTYRRLADSAYAGLPGEDAWRMVAEQASAQPPAARMLSFQHSGVFQLAAAGPQAKIVLESDGVELWLLIHGRNDWLCLQLRAATALYVEEVLVDGAPIVLVEDWDDEQEAVVRKRDVLPALQSGAKVQLRVREAGSADQD